MIPDELRAALAEVTRAKAQRAGLGNLSKSIEEITVDLAQRLAKLGFTLEIKHLPPRK